MASHWVVATTNKGKWAEFSHMLKPLGVQLHAMEDFQVAKVEETATTFVGNARLKAEAAYLASKLPALADDSGLVVDALNGAPGIYSSRYAGEEADDKHNNEKLLRELADVPPSQRTAHFTCALVLLENLVTPPVIAEGKWYGSILLAPQGNNGFGYDPIFLPQGLNVSAAELSADEKSRLSHRAQAMQLLYEKLAAK